MTEEYLDTHVDLPVVADDDRLIYHFADSNVWPPPCDIMPRDVSDGRREISNDPNGVK